MDFTTIPQAVRQWPVDDHLDLVFRLWDQLVDDGWQSEPNDELNAELDRRLALHEANPTNVRTWEQVVNRRAIVKFRALKWQSLRRIKGEES